MRGQLVSRSKDTHLLRVYVGMVDNKRKYLSKTIHGNKRYAELELAKWVVEIESGTFVEPTRLTVATLADRWLRDHVQRTCRPTTYDNYEVQVRRYIKPHLGHVLAGKLHPILINDFYTKIQSPDAKGRRLKASSIAATHRVLLSMFHTAVKWGVVADNPVRRADPPRLEKSKPKVLTQVQAAKLLDATRNTQMYLPVLLFLTTGIRVGEMCGMRWSDVDFDSGTISIQRTVSKTSKGAALFDHTKTQSSTRVIEVDTSVLETLKAFHRTSFAARIRLGAKWMDYVLHTPEGGFVSPASVSCRLRRIMKRIGLPAYTAHPLRHTMATLMLKAGVQAKVVQDRLGHSSVAITTNVYQHVLPGMQRTAARVVEQMLLDTHIDNVTPIARTRESK